MKEFRVARRIERGFTLIELMVVILIIGLLATLIIPRVRNAADRAKRVTAQANISQLKSGLEQYYMDVGSYPTTDQGLNALVAAPSTNASTNDGSSNWQGPYLEKVPLDPWNHQFFYQSDGSGYTLKSFGADGVEGGDGKNADIDGSSSS